MRISAEKSSPHYDPELARKARVLLDGEELQDCQEASEEEGWAIVVDWNSLELVRLTGQVSILFDREVP